MSDNDRDLIVEALEHTYKDAAKYSDGIIVIDRNAKIEYLDLGAQKILGVSRTDAEGSGLDVFLPLDRRHLHKGWIDKEYAKLDEALQNKTTYKGKIMGGSVNSLEPRYLSALNFDGNKISIGLEFQPLFWDKRDGFAGFISVDPSQNLKERAIVQNEEAEKAVKNRQLQLGLDAIDAASIRFTGGFFFLRNEVFKNGPGASFASFTIMFTGSFVALAAILLGTGIIKIPSLPTPQQFIFNDSNLPSIPPSSEPTPQHGKEHQQSK